MKIKSVILILLVTMLESCVKEYPKPDNDNGIFCSNSIYTNHYILTGISSQLVNKNTLSIIDSSISLDYRTFYIAVSYMGKLIDENTYYSDYINQESENPYVLLPEEHRYFINKIASLEVTTDTPYNDSLHIFYSIPLNDMNIIHQNKYFQNIYGFSFGEDRLGYGPLYIELKVPPDTNKRIAFTITIKDDKGNAFTTTTDKIFVTR